MRNSMVPRKSDSLGTPQIEKPQEPNKPSTKKKSSLYFDVILLMQDYHSYRAFNRPKKELLDGIEIFTSSTQSNSPHSLLRSKEWHLVRRILHRDESS